MMQSVTMVYMKDISDKQKELIIENYKATRNRAETSRQTGVHKYQVFKILSENGIECDSAQKRACRKYTLNEDTFENIDTPEKAYWLGFIAADGHVGNESYLSICLSVRDKDVLVSFLNFVGSNSKIAKSWRKSPCSETMCELSKITLHSKKMTTDLIRHGIFPRKSLILMPPKIDSYLNRFFILGYFDGDGGINFSNISTRNNVFQSNFAFTSTKEVCDWIAEFFKEYGFCSTMSKRWKDGKNNFTLSLSGNDKIVLALRILYTDCNVPFMKRKYERYLFLEKKLMEKKQNGYFVKFRERDGWNYTFKFNGIIYSKYGFASRDLATVSCAEKLRELDHKIGLLRLFLNK